MIKSMNAFQIRHTVMGFKYFATTLWIEFIGRHSTVHGQNLQILRRQEEVLCSQFKFRNLWSWNRFCWIPLVGKGQNPISSFHSFWNISNGSNSSPHEQKRQPSCSKVRKVSKDNRQRSISLQEILSNHRPFAWRGGLNSQSAIRILKKYQNYFKTAKERRLKY